MAPLSKRGYEKAIAEAALARKGRSGIGRTTALGQSGSAGFGERGHQRIVHEFTCFMVTWTTYRYSLQCCNATGTVCGAAMRMPPPSPLTIYGRDTDPMLMLAPGRAAPLRRAKKLRICRNIPYIVPILRDANHTPIYCPYIES